MMPIARKVTFVTAFIAAALTTTTAAWAQNTPDASQAAAARPIIPVQVLITIAEYDGDTLTSSVPYMIWENANDGREGFLSAAQSVPIPTTEFVQPEALQDQTARSFQYQNVGATIRANVATTEDGRFRVDLDINDSSITPTDEPGGLVNLRSVNFGNVLLLRAGQTAQFLAASDRVTGTLTKIEVTLTVLE